MADIIIFGPWSGAVTSSSANVKVAVTNNVQVRLALSEKTGAGGDLISPSFHTPDAFTASEISVASFQIKNLKSDTRYHYAIEADGNLMNESRGQLRTFPPEDAPASFKFVCAGDAATASNHKVFASLKEEDPLFFCHLGDLHYSNVHEADARKYRQVYKRVLNAKRQAELYKNVPIAYTWDDHDYDNNGADKTAPGRRVARLTYQECVPHYPLVEGSGDVAIYQAFTVGRVRFLVSDSRSERTPKSGTDNDKKSILGTKQKEWLKAELKAGKNKYRLVVWINSVPWIGKKKEDADNWFGYSTERDEIGSFIENEGIQNLCMLAADAHMLAIDDGSNNTGQFGRGRFPVFQAAPLDSTRSSKGGPFKFGPFVDDSGQYGLFTVEDTGGPTARVTWLGKNINNGETPVKFSFESPRS